MLLFEDLAVVPIIFFLGALAPQGGNGWEGLLAFLLGAAVVAAMLVLGRCSSRACSPRRRGPRARSCSCRRASSSSSSPPSPPPPPACRRSSARSSPGLLIAETDYRSEVEVITAPFRGLALGVFLITVGMSLDLRLILRDREALVLAFAAVMLVKAAVTGGLLRLTGARKSGVAAEAGLIMASPSETTLIVLAAAASAGLISRETAASGPSSPRSA
jgi:CPA2 family monovalent cation:H+ antiporter-2